MVRVSVRQNHDIDVADVHALAAEAPEEISGIGQQWAGSGVHEHAMAAGIDQQTDYRDGRRSSPPNAVASA